MKKLTYSDYMEGNIKIKGGELDEKVVLQHFDDEIEMTYDELGRVFNEGGQYIADVDIFY